MERHTREELDSIAIPNKDIKKPRHMVSFFLYVLLTIDTH